MTTDLKKESNFPNPKDPFNKLNGEWALKDDNWCQNRGKTYEHIKINNHYTNCRQLNTDDTLFAIIDGATPRGHIFW